MARKQKISQYRERLDQTLASHDLVNDKMLAALVKNQLLRSSQYETEGYINNVLEKRTMEVSNFLDMLRSASGNDKVSRVHGKQHNEWKLKQDTEECRIMYREGPEGTPFHSLLAEGYIDAPVDVCLCVSWESSLYKKWWPQFSIPTFKIITCQCLQKIRIGEQIALVRVKLSWPLSDREAVVHYFEFEYFQDDLIIVLTNSISDWDGTNRSFDGFTNDGTPEAKDMVRIDMVGGFALQKVTPGRSYFRTIVNMDMKLDFVPPSFINFVSRQLVGNGFRLYQKLVASVSKGDEDFSKALADPLYSQIRVALYSNDIMRGTLEPADLKNHDARILPEEHLIKAIQADVKDTDQKVLGNDCASECFPECAPVIDQNACVEIEEEEIEESIHLDENSMQIDQPLMDQIEEKCHVNHNRKVFISPAVEQALETLDKVISLAQNVGFNAQTRFLSGFTPEELSTVKKNAEKDSTSSEDNSCSGVGTCIEASNNELAEKTSLEPTNSSNVYESRHLGSNSYAREVKDNRILPASPEANLPLPFGTDHVTLFSPGRGKAEAPILDKTIECCTQVSAEANGIRENSLNERKKLKQHKKQRFCCLHFASTGDMA